MFRGWGDEGVRPVDLQLKLMEEARGRGHVSKRGGTPNKKGCPANDGKEHVYLHILRVTFRERDGEAKEVYRYHTWGPCIGCDHIYKGHGRPSSDATPDMTVQTIWKPGVGFVKYEGKS